MTRLILIAACLVAAVAVRSDPATVSRCATVKVADFRMTRSQARGDGTYSVELKTSGESEGLICVPGDALADGIIKSVAADHVIVEAELPGEGQPPPKRLLRFTPPQQLPPITLGHDTTWITSPLLPDGTPDYGKWLNQKYGAGVTAENNAAPALDRALGGLVDVGWTFWDGLVFQGEPSNSPPTSRITTRPWVDRDCAGCVQRLERNEKVLAAVAEASRRSRFFEPVPEGTRSPYVMISPLLKYRMAANALAGRGMLRLGRGEWGLAAEDALTVQRLALVTGQGQQWLDRAIAVALRHIGTPLLSRLAAAPSLTANDARHLLGELERLPEMPAWAEVFDQSDRLTSLDRLLLSRQLVAERGAGALVEILEPAWLPGRTWDPSPLVYLLPSGVIDWHEALQLSNRWNDLLVAAVRAQTPEERQRARAALQDEDDGRKRQVEAIRQSLFKAIRSEATLAPDVAAAAEQLGRTADGRKQLALFLIAQPILVLRPDARDGVSAGIAWNEGEARFRLGVTAVALAAHRLEKGGFPPNLEALAPEYLTGRFAPSAPLPGYVWAYYAGAVDAKGPASTYALAAIPDEKGAPGARGFCLDSTGVMRFTHDGTPPAIANGICDPGVALVP